MANEEHLKILKRGVHVWNKWREEHPAIQVDLRYADLCGADLRKMDFGGSRLRTRDYFSANPNGADFWRVNLSEANLTEADFYNASFGDADLSRATLRSAGLIATRFRGVKLSGADLTDTRIGYTIFDRVDLSEVKGLETVAHDGPSDVSISTIYQSKGQIPEAFLRDTGVPQTFITYVHSLVGSPFDSCFISYSSKDQEFAERLHADLQRNEVRCWFALRDLKIGDRFRERIDEAIHLHDKLLIVLSENSVASLWVEKEIETAFEEERQQNRIVLFPIRLDDAVMETKQAWAADIRRARHIGDFRDWKNHNSYKRAFDRLLRDLHAKNKAESATQK